jgi:hypothetical protein
MLCQLVLFFQFLFIQLHVKYYLFGNNVSFLTFLIFFSLMKKDEVLENIRFHFSFLVYFLYRCIGLIPLFSMVLI